MISPLGPSVESIYSFFFEILYFVGDQKFCHPTFFFVNVRYVLIFIQTYFYVALVDK